MSENIKQKILKILEYFNAYICHHYQPKMYASKYSKIFSLFCLIFSDIKMLIFGLSFLLFVLQLSGRNGFCYCGKLVNIFIVISNRVKAT